MKFLAPFLRLLLTASFGIFSAGVLLSAAAYFYVAPALPSIEELSDVRFQVPLRIYSRDGLLLGEYGEKRRTPMRYDELPPPMIQAFLAAEDDRFFVHPGVDYQGLLRAALALARTGEKRQGGSTITMQVARNFFLSTEKTYLRKIKEIFLALKIERALDKAQILELYLNKIYLGHRAYGVAAAAQVYYGSTLDQLSVPQIAMIAGLPKAPSRDNPITNPQRALERRNYVLARMRELGHLTQAQYQTHSASPNSARLHAQNAEVEAPFVAEMVRALMIGRYGHEAYTGGFQVITTLDSTRQQAANRALRNALLAYERRHGYRGAEGHVELESAVDDEEAWSELLGKYEPVAGLHAGLVLGFDTQSTRVFAQGPGMIELPWDGVRWARAYRSANHRGPAPKSPEDVLRIGDVVRVHQDQKGNWRLAQIPEVEGALVSLLPDDGALAALAGGFDYYRSKFNRALQAQRQPGSSFKPFVYSAALESGFTAASVINDAPVVFDDPALETTWRPENYSGKFYGPTRLREALVRSRNLVSVRLLRAIGAGYTIDYAGKFGFDSERLPHDLSLALGSGSATPWAMAGAYAVFANGGFRVEPYVIERILDVDGVLLYQSQAPVACRENCAEEVPAADVAQPGLFADTPPTEDTAAETATPRPLAERVISAQNAYLMTSMMRDVIQRGTGRRARALGRTDLAGKTGTTNDQRDAWFCGFNAALVTTTWVGYDRVQPLGVGETGSRAALPMWIEYMGAALKGVPPALLPPPEGLVTVRIDPDTGLLPAPGQNSDLFETFRTAFVPDQTAEPIADRESTPGGTREPDPLF